MSAAGALQGRPLPGIPGWARRQRQLIDLLQASVNRSWNVMSETIG